MCKGKFLVPGLELLMKGTLAEVSTTGIPSNARTASQDEAGFDNITPNESFLKEPVIQASKN